MVNLGAPKRRANKDFQKPQQQEVGTSQEKLQHDSKCEVMGFDDVTASTTEGHGKFNLTAFTQEKFMVWWVELGTCPQVDKNAGM